MRKVFTSFEHFNAVNEAKYWEKAHDEGDSFVVKNDDDLPKGYKDVKVGDKITITRIGKNSQEHVYFTNISDEYGLTNDDIEKLKNKK